MSIGFDPGNGGGTGLPAADQGTLDWLNGLTVGQQQPQPDYGLTPQSGAEDYGNYDPYAGAPPTQGQGYSDYVDAGAQPNPYFNNTEPTFSSGVSEPDQTQPNFYLDQTPSLPDFSAGIRQQQDNAPVFQQGPWQGAANNTEPDFSSGVDTSGQNPDIGLTQSQNESPVNHWNPDTTPWVLDPDGVWRQHGPNDYRKTTAFQYSQNNLGEGLQASGGRPTTNAQSLGTAYWDPNARGDYSPDQNDPMRGWYDRTRQQKWQSEYTTAVTAQRVNPTPQGAALIKRLEDEAAQWDQWVADYNAGAQERAGRGYTSQDMADRQVKSQLMTDQMPLDQAVTDKRNALVSERGRQVAALKNVNPYDQPEQYGLQGTQQYGGAYAPDYTRQTGTALAGETFDTLLAIVNRGYGFEAAVKQYGLTPAEAAQIGLAASITDPARLARTRQLWIDAHIGTQFDNPTLQYTNSWNISPRDVALGVTGLRTAADVIAPNQTPMQRIGQVGKAIERAFTGVGVATQFATTLADNVVYLVRQAATGQPVVDGNHPGPASAASAKYLQTVDDIKTHFYNEFIASYYGPGGMLAYGGNATLDTPEKVATEAARFRQENPALDMALDQGIQIALGELGAIGGRTVAAGVRGYRAPIDIPAPVGVQRVPEPVARPEVGNARPETPGAPGRPNLAGEGDNIGGLPPVVTEPRPAGLADPAIPVAPSVDVPRPTPALDRPVVGDQSLPPAAGSEPIAPPARPTGRTATEPPPVVSSVPDAGIIAPQTRTAFDEFIADPPANVRRDRYIPSTEYIARNTGATIPEVRALLDEALADGRIENIGQGRDVRLVFASRTPPRSAVRALLDEELAPERIENIGQGRDVRLVFASRTPPRSAVNVPEPYNTRPVAKSAPPERAPLRERLYDQVAKNPEYEGASSAEIRAAVDRQIATTYGKNAKYGEFRPDQLVDTPPSAPQAPLRNEPRPAVSSTPDAPIERPGASTPTDATQRAVVEEYRAALQRADPGEIKYYRDLASSEGVSDNWLAEVERNTAADIVAADPVARTAQIQDRITEIDHSPEAVVFNYVNANGQLRAVNPVTGKRLVARSKGKFGAQPEEIWNIPGSGYDDVAARVQGYNPRTAESLDDFFPRAIQMWQERRKLKAELQVLRNEAGKVAPDVAPQAPRKGKPNTPVGTLPGTPPREFGGARFTDLTDSPYNTTAAPLKLEMQYGGLPDAEVSRIKAQDAGQGSLFGTEPPRKGVIRRSVQNDPTLYSIGPAGAKAVARGAIGGLAGYAAPASDEEDRWRHALLGATLGVGVGGINKVIPAIDRKAGTYLYGTMDRGAAEAFWKGTAKDLPDIGAGRKGKGLIFAATKDSQRAIVGDRVSSAIYAALDAELKDAGLTTLVPTANKRAAETIIKDLLNNPGAHDLTGVFEGTLGEQLKKLFADYNAPLTNGVRDILAEAVPNGGLLTPDVIAKRFGTLISGVLSDPAAIGVTKTNPLIKLNQSIVRELAPVWMTLNPRYHINNTLGNLAGEISSILANPDMIGANAGKGRKAMGATGSGNRYSSYADADLTGNVNQRGGKLSKIPGMGKVIDKAGDAANVVEKNFKDRIFDRNRVGYVSSRMRFEFGQEGLGDIAPTLFSDHFGGKSPQLTGIPTSVQESLRGVVDANEAQTIVNRARTAGTITPTQAGTVMKTLRTALYDGERFADTEAAWAMRDYRIRSNGDWLLDHVTPLHFWATHNILATARLAAKNPALVAPIAAGLLYWRSQNEDLPDSLKWTIELPYKQMIKSLPQDVQDEIISTVDSIYGQGTDLRLRPWNWINPAIGAAAQTLTPEQATGHSAAMSMPQLITGWMEKLGYNPSPAWDAMGTALRRIPEVAGFDPIIVAGLNNKEYFNPSIAGQWGSWTRAATMFMANNADASLSDTNTLRGAADLLREVPYKFNSIVYGDRYSQYEHEAIVKLIANQERLGKITHDQALNALKNGEKDGVFLAARQEFTDQAAGRGAVSYAGLPVTGRNDYQRAVANVNNQYFDPGATKADKKALITDNQWITTDWSKKDSPNEIGQAQELNALWDQYNALPPGKQRSAVYAQIQALAPAGGVTAPTSPAPSATPTASTPATAKQLANVGKGLATGFRAADVSNEFLTDADKAKSQALWAEYEQLKDQDQAAKDKTGKNPGAASAFFTAHADEFNRYDVHRTLEPRTTTTNANSPSTVGKGLATGFRAADVSNEYLTDADKKKSDALWAEYDRLKAIDQAAYDKTGKNPGNAAAFRKANAAEFNRLDVHRALEPTFYPSGSVLPTGPTTVAAKPATGSATSTSTQPRTTATTPAKAPATTRTPSAPASAPRSTTTAKPAASTGQSPAKTSTSTGSKTSTSLPSSSPYATKPSQNRSPGNPTTGVPFSEGLSQWSEAQRNARPFVSSALAAASNSPVSSGKAGNTAPVTPIGSVPDKPFSASAYQYAVKQYTANPNSNSLNTIFGMLRKLDGQGKDITPYAWQVIRDLEKSIVPRIKAYQGPDRATGDRIRGQMLAAVKSITPDLDGLQLLMEIQGALS